MSGWSNYMGTLRKINVMIGVLMLFPSMLSAQIVENTGQQPESKYKLQQKKLTDQNYKSTQPASDPNKKNFIPDGKQRAENKKGGGNNRQFGQDHEFRLGVEASKWKDHEKQDLLELDYYSKVGMRNGTPLSVYTDDVGVTHTQMPSQTQAAKTECMQKHPVEGVFCVGPDVLKDPFYIYIQPLWGYWMPFQKIETIDIPGVTGYADKQKLQQILEDADEEKENLVDKMISDDGQIPPEQNTAPQFAIEVSTTDVEKNQDAVDSIFNGKYDTKKRYHNITPEGQGFRYVEMNAHPTWYHEYYREDPRFGSAGLEVASKELPWCHQGAIYGVNNFLVHTPFVEEVPHSFSIEPLLIVITRLVSASYEDQNLKQFTPQRGKNYHTLKAVNIDGGWASEDLVQGEQVKIAPSVDGEDDPGKEIKLPVGFNTTLGPFVNWTSNLSPAKVAETGAARWLRFIDQYILKANNNKDIELSRVSQLYYTEKNGQSASRVYHPWERFDKGTLKRDKQQQLRNERMYPGCQEMNRNAGDSGSGGNQDEWATNWVGPEYGAANDNLEREKNHWNVTVHWRYIQCCPFGTVPIGRPVEFQTF